ncbi:zinc finger MYM-type protein 3 [Orussus abietinus]|uniref:zinc finger MYM-type protein 3 n=1 Tax=Orussus abietinus TaxID=222816 RepID=UPI0006269946|nr:zinc finger MYM-type protein 3 [Orussus abietinus]XP_012280637.1 zinc finger MYM-type protein 3 [Orussus abietinus]XP_012280638.1 zinc finger MYM-type protein 3 [Orussus abietinus]
MEKESDTSPLKETSELAETARSEDDSPKELSEECRKSDTKKVDSDSSDCKAGKSSNSKEKTGLKADSSNTKSKGSVDGLKGAKGKKILKSDTKTHVDKDQLNPDVQELNSSKITSNSASVEKEDSASVSPNTEVASGKKSVYPPDPPELQNDESQEAVDSVVSENASESQAGECTSEDGGTKDKPTSPVYRENDEIPSVDSKKDDNDSDNPDKDSAVDKTIIEPENTEFVQISQDKQDDSQIECQSIDAEDPFGGENLASENMEPMETEAGEGNFRKLGDQADNLQDVVNAKDGKFKDNYDDDSKTGAGSENETDKTILEDTVEPVNNSQNLTATETEEFDDSTNDVDKLSKNKNNVSSNKSTKDKPQIEGVDDSEKSNNASEITQMETDEEQSTVLPGQDDELCIIPDSMKVIIPQKPTETENKESTENEKSEEPAVISESKKDGEVVKKKATRITRRTSSDLKESKSHSTDSSNEDKADEQKKRDTPGENVITTDIIDVDEESKNSEIEEILSKEICKQCNEEKPCKIKVKVGSECFSVCSKVCQTAFTLANNKATDIPSDGVNSKREKRCANCLLIVEPTDERNLSWETMEFCNEECLGKFQIKYGSYCRNCNGSVQAVSLGKYCVRFGYDVRQFCCSTCLEEFKKGLKVCSYCQKDISSGAEGFLAPVGDKGQFKDFCTQDCMEKYTKMSSAEPLCSEKKACSVCQEEKIVHCEVQIGRTNSVAICSDPCFAAFKFVNKVDPDQCSTCKKFFELPNKKTFVVFYENEAHTFCTKTCLNIFIITNRKIVPCNWCKVKKYNFDMIKKELKTGQVMMMCSLNCLTLYQVSINAVSARRINCDFCKEFSQAQYHLTMSDATIRNFCSYNCVMNFQAQYTKSPITIPSSDDPVPTGMPKRTIPQRTIIPAPPKPTEIQPKKNLPVISSVTSLASMGNGQSLSQQASPTSQQNVNTSVNNVVPVPQSTTVHGQATQVIYKQQVITRPPSPVKVHNKSTQCKPVVHTKGVSVRPHPCSKSTQTDEIQQIAVPIPVPIYVPVPMHMYSMPYPVPFPFPLPIPVPIFIPTTRNSAKGIFKDIKRIQEKIPADPFEAELLMMAEMVATEKKVNESDSDSAEDNRDDDGEERGNSHTDGFSPDAVDSSNTFGDDMLQMALKMATGELDEPAVDLEAALTPNTITATQTPSQPEAAMDNDVQPERLIAATRGRKRIVSYKPRSTPSKRGRRVSGANDIPLMPPPDSQPPQPRIMEPIEKPDANMALKYTFGVNAWRQWVVTKNAELEKQSTPTRKVKLFKTDLLQLTADELNYSLCLFVKEVRKPNGAEYAPDTIYYLCLGIQQYLFENNRIDNIFTDSYYEKFTDCLNEVAKKFSVLYNDAQYIVTRVEEEHLWECKQLGAHSPHVLLSTLMFFNTKHFNLVTVEEHMQLSFSHIMKHWKRNPAAQPAAIAGKVPGSRNVLLRFYPPQSTLEANSRKKKVYEQQENEENPLRCPVKLYEFYLSKCPESVKTRNDVFYLLPERSCVPDSPVWYSTSPLAKEHLIKMLYRVKMVKEINVALLTS